MNKNSKRTIAGGAVACLIMTAMPAIPAVAAETTSLAGAGRVETAIKIAEASWNGAWKDSKTAVLASGNDANLVDALAIAPLAYAEKAPILLSRDSKDAVDAATLKEITDRKVEKVYLAAGTGVLSEKVEAQLKSAGVKEVVRLGGLNRYETAKNINAKLGSYTKVAVVNGEIGLADALSVASIAANQGMAIVMTSNKDAAPAEDLTGKTVYAIGGSGVISDSVVSKLSATRFGGSTRYETNAKVVEGLKANVKFDTIYLADGANDHLVDSLTGSVLAAQTASPIVLADASLDAKQKEVLTANLTKDTKVLSFGGTVNSKVKDAVNNIINPTPGKTTDEATVKVDSVTALNLKQVKVSFASAVTDSELKDEVEDVNNYVLDDKDGDEVKDVIKKVKLDDSKKFAIITFKDELNDKDKYIIENNEKYTLYVDSSIVGGKDDYKADLNFKDTDFPTIKKVESVGIDTIKVTFSEPMKPDNLEEVSKDDTKKGRLDKDNFTINELKDGKDNGELSISRVELVNDNTEANIVLGGNLKDKQELNVKVSGSNEDYAGLSAQGKVEKVTVKEDKDAPTVKSFKDIESNKVTLVFDKDIKFEGTDSLVIDKEHNSADLENFYHSGNESNTPKRVEADGKNLIIEFPDNIEIPDGESKIYIKAEALESLWEVKNQKLTFTVKRDEDNTKPTVTKVWQDEDSSNKVHVKFSEKVKLDSSKDGGALNRDNYIIKDKDGKEQRVSNVVKDGDSEREFILTTSKDLEDGDKYTVTIKNVEDKSGNAIAEVTKDITAEDRDGVDIDDVKIHLYNAGENDQKITVDFDRKMTTGTGDKAKNSIQDASKYTIICLDGNIFDGKDRVNVNTLYKNDIKVNDDGYVAEIKIPFKSGEEDSYNLTGHKLQVQVGVVEDSHGVATLGAFTKDITAADKIGYDDEPEATSTEKIEFKLDAKADTFKDEDFVVVAADNEADAKAAATAGKSTDKATIITASYKTTDDGSETKVVATLSKDFKDPAYDDNDMEHILTYDGKYWKTKQPVYVVTVGTTTVSNATEKVSGTKDKYGNRLSLGAIKVADSIVPALVDNGKRSKVGKYQGVDNSDEAIEFWQPIVNGHPSTDAALVLTFEEPIDESSLSRTTFDLDGDFEDGDDPVAVYTMPGHPEKVVIELKNVKDGSSDVTIEDGFTVEQTSLIRDKNDNDLDKFFKSSVGSFKKLTVDPRKGGTTPTEDVNVTATKAALATLKANPTQANKDAALAAAAKIADATIKADLTAQINAVVIGKPGETPTATVTEVDNSLMGTSIVKVSLGNVDPAKYTVKVKGVTAKYSATSKTYNAILKVYVENPAAVDVAKDIVVTPVQ